MRAGCLHAPQRAGLRSRPRPVSSCSRQVATKIISLNWSAPLSSLVEPAPARNLELEGLQAQINSLQAQLAEAQRRAQFAESRMSILETRVQEGRALNLVHEATQAFRHHVIGLPAGVDTSMFFEDEARVIGKGGQAVVYSWLDNYAVKVDRLAYRYGYKPGGGFEPERAADLLPAFLPPHANVMAPKAWWVGSPPSPAQHHPQRVQPEPSFVLYTLYDRYNTSLYDCIKQLRSTVNTCANLCAVGQCGALQQQSPVLLDLHSILVIVRDVAAALAHLAQHRVCHCDVKAENVLLVMEPEAQDEQAAPSRRRVSKAVLIDFGLARMLPNGVDRVDARGGTWAYKAPEQMSGPPGMAFGGQELGVHPYVTLSTDVWSLGALICMLCHNGAVPASPGLPWVLPSDQLAKWGDRPNGHGGQEPFFMTWDDILPVGLCNPPKDAVTAPSNSRDFSPAAAAISQGSASNTASLEAASSTSCAVSTGAMDALLSGLMPPEPHSCVLLDNALHAQDAQQYAHVMGLLRRLAWGCMQTEPSQRLTAAQVQSAAENALHMVDKLCSV